MHAQQGRLVLYDVYDCGVGALDQSGGCVLALRADVAVLPASPPLFPYNTHRKGVRCTRGGPGLRSGPRSRSISRRRVARGGQIVLRKRRVAAWDLRSSAT